jgi:hypothetical protein
MIMQLRWFTGGGGGAWFVFSAGAMGWLLAVGGSCGP